jgi:hypothetical protein
VFSTIFKDCVLKIWNGGSSAEILKPFYMNPQNDTGFVPVKNRNYLALEPRNEAEKSKLEEKLNLHQQLVELATKAAQKWAAGPGALVKLSLSAECYDYGAAYIGVVFSVSARGTDSDGYAAYPCPTIEDGYVLQADFAKIAESPGL